MGRGGGAEKKIELLCGCLSVAAVPCCCCCCCCCGMPFAPLACRLRCVASAGRKLTGALTGAWHSRLPAVIPPTPSPPWHWPTARRPPAGQPRPTSLSALPPLPASPSKHGHHRRSGSSPTKQQAAGGAQEGGSGRWRAVERQGWGAAGGGEEAVIEPPLRRGDMPFIVPTLKLRCGGRGTLRPWLRCCCCCARCCCCRCRCCSQGSLGAHLPPPHPHLHPTPPAHIPCPSWLAVPTAGRAHWEPTCPSPHPTRPPTTSLAPPGWRWLQGSLGAHLRRAAPPIRPADSLPRQLHQAVGAPTRQLRRRQRQRIGRGHQNELDPGLGERRRL